MNKRFHQVGGTPRPLWRTQTLKENAAHLLFVMTACIYVLAVVLICVFIFVNGVPGISTIGVWEFLSGARWKPDNNIFGILPFILGSVYDTARALILGIPAGLMTALFLSRFAGKKAAAILWPAVSLLAGIPSVVYGFFGLVVLVPLVRNAFGGTVSSLLTASVLLGMMLLTTIVTVSESALNAVPDSYREGCFGLGAGRLRTTFKVVLPSAVPGILLEVILATGRCASETAALIYTAGTVVKLPASLFDSVRTLAVHMYVISNEGLYINQSYATAVVLLGMVLGINALSSLIAGRIGRRSL